MEGRISSEMLADFGRRLRESERSESTVENYLRAVRRFAAWLGGGELTREAAALWKEELCRSGLSPATVNNMLTALNRFLELGGFAECRVRLLRLQRRLFRETGRELTRGEYERLLGAAERLGRERLALAIETMCAAGLRVSELGAITVEAAREGRAEIRLKGKIRTILLPGKLCRKLLRYAAKRRIGSGAIFLSRGGRRLDRRRIWEEMKLAAREAGVEERKVFPHNLRHLFARCFYRATRDISKLADILGHSSLNTTRIYLISTGEEHARLLNGLRLVQ